MSLVDIAVPAGHKFLMEIYDNILLIVGKQTTRDFKTTAKASPNHNPVIKY
jgi:hypothetical protein